MLTCTEIEVAKATGLLRPLRFPQDWRGQPRAMLLSAPLDQALMEGQKAADPQELKRWVSLHALMVSFVQGDFFTERQLKQLAEPKHEVWELKFREKPGIRVFGRFALPDVFIATHLIERKPLGAKGSVEFEIEKLNCEQIYRASGLTSVFTDSPHFRYEKYITSNAAKTLRVPS